jgi:hypothetical protein
MTPAETDPMSRSLLALSLYAFAAIALAGPPPASDDTGKPAKPAAPTATVSDSDSAPAAAPVQAPNRTGSPSRSSAKRWHSMLPGMIR